MCQLPEFPLFLFHFIKFITKWGEFTVKKRKTTSSTATCEIHKQNTKELHVSLQSENYYLFFCCCRCCWQFSQIRKTRKTLISALNDHKHWFLNSFLCVALFLTIFVLFSFSAFHRIENYQHDWVRVTRKHTRVWFTHTADKRNKKIKKK